MSTCDLCARGFCAWHSPTPRRCHCGATIVTPPGFREVDECATCAARPRCGHCWEHDCVCGLELDYGNGTRHRFSQYPCKRCGERHGVGIGNPSNPDTNYARIERGETHTARPVAKPAPASVATAKRQ